MEKITKSERNRLIGASIGFVLCIVLLIYCAKLAKKQNAANAKYELVIQRAFIEAGYVQGQADALKNIIRVRPINDSTYTWITSPWGSLKPVYDTVGVTIKYK